VLKSLVWKQKTVNVLNSKEIAIHPKFQFF
jgi:hypothetical protein